MLTFIENRLEELFEHIETMPQWKIDIAEKVLYIVVPSTSHGPKLNV